MKNLLFILSLSFLVLSSCSSGDDNNNIQIDLLIGKWNLVSDIYEETNGDIGESITTCQAAYWQYNFVNDENLIWRTTSDDPALELSECIAGFYDGDYHVNNDVITTTISFEDRTETLILKVESLSNSTLVLRTLEQAEYYRKFTYEKE